MSDITKKIFSIEPADELVDAESQIIRPLTDGKLGINSDKKTLEPVPEFVTRSAVQPLASPPSPLDEDIEIPKAGGWLIFGLGLIYLIGAGLFFGSKLISENAELMTYSGFILIVTLPLFLLFLLWRTLRHLSWVSYQNARLSKAADLLVSPDTEALTRTENLAVGIRAQISEVNKDLSNTANLLKDVQLSVTRESQALNVAGVTLTKRSDEVGQNLTLQRQALDSMTDTFDTRMSTLSTQIADTSQTLDGVCTNAETKLLNATEALNKASETVDGTVTTGSTQIDGAITSLGEMSRKLDDTVRALSEDLASSAQTLRNADGDYEQNKDELQRLNSQTETQINELNATLKQGHSILAELKSASESRTKDLQSYYYDLSTQLKQSENETLSLQGKTSRMVESNLEQMRQEFSRMESDLKDLRAKLSDLRHSSSDLTSNETYASRLNLKPLDSDFPPVEPPRFAEQPPRLFAKAETLAPKEEPLNLGIDLEIESNNEPLVDYGPDVIRRPFEINEKKQSKGFGRRTNKEEKSGWRWRDMLGTLERPDTDMPAFHGQSETPSREINAVALLSDLKLSPAAIVDEGTVIDATQARINGGEAKLTSIVVQRLPEAVAHLKDTLNDDMDLKSDLRDFTVNFSNMIGNTPPTAPALRAALGSPEGRAYLLCAAAFKPKLRA